MTETEYHDPVAEHRAEALHKANRIRLYRAARKKELKGLPRREAAIYVKMLLAAPGELDKTWKVHDVIKALPDVGPHRATQMMRAAGVGLSVTLGTATLRQVRELHDYLDMWANR